MKRLLLYLFAGLSLHATAYAISIDSLSKTVVFLRQRSQSIEMKGGKQVEVWYRDPETEKLEPKLDVMSGSGLIIRYHGSDYLVTAKHVAKALSAKAEIVMNLSGGKSTSLTFEWISQQQIIKGARWFHHPKADISIHPLCYPTDSEQIVIGEDLFPQQKKEIPLLTAAYVLGFPLGQGVQQNLSPLAKETRIASRLTSVDNPNVSSELLFILLDQALAQGYSGAPVFYTEDIMSNVSIAGQRMKGGEELHFVGILSGGLSDATGGKISLVVPTSYLREILESDEFIQYEKSLKEN
ncbi:MAG: S1C family serine protease [Verrucomicrobiota bacterium]